ESGGGRQGSARGRGALSARLRATPAQGAEGCASGCDAGLVSRYAGHSRCAAELEILAGAAARKIWRGSLRYPAEGHGPSTVGRHMALDGRERSIGREDAVDHQDLVLVRGDPLRGACNHGSEVREIIEAQRSSYQKETVRLGDCAPAGNIYGVRNQITCLLID